MNLVTIQDLINSAIQQLNEFHLCNSTIDSYRSCAFKPVSDFHNQKKELYYQSKLMDELNKVYHKQYTLGIISKNVLNWRMRGLLILNEIYQYNNFKWKVFTCKKEPLLPRYYKQILLEFCNTIGNIKRISIYQSIAKRYFLYLDHNHINLVFVSCSDIKNFMLEISVSRPKTMDDVVTVLKRLHSFLRDKGLLEIRFESVLFSPRARDKKVLPCIAIDEIQLITDQINTKTPTGKRDFAIIQLGIRMGLRAGDIANLQLQDIEWKKNEVYLVQGKTQELLVLPLDKFVGTSLIDYILNGRPKANTPYIFLRSIAPYIKLKDGVSVACIFRKYMKSAGISHSHGDGRTFHGLRRRLGTEMIIQGVPVSTVSQVLGHRNSSKTTRQYIALNMEELR